MKIGFIHKAERPDSWGYYYKWLIRKQSSHELVDCLEDIGPNEIRFGGKGCDVYLRIGDSLMYHTPDWMRPLIYYCSDSHVEDGVQNAAISLKADYTFWCQKNALTGELREEWLPHAAEYFPKVKRNKGLVVSSAMVLAHGNPIFDLRTKIADALKHELREKAKIGRGPMHNEMAEMYADSLIVWNHSVNNDVNMRMFEGAAAGSLVLTNEIRDNGLEELFGDTIVQYRSPGHLVDLIKYFMQRPELAYEKGRKARAMVEDKHTYANRLHKILERAQHLVGSRKKHGRGTGKSRAKSAASSRADSPNDGVTV